MKPEVNLSYDKWVVYKRNDMKKEKNIIIYAPRAIDDPVISEPVISPIAHAGRDVTETLPADGESEYHLLSGGVIPGTYDIASWKWTIISKPTGSDAYITKSDKQEAEFHFTKNTKNSGSYVVRLQVCDIHNKCSNDDIRLKYIFTLVIPPIAHAGRDVTETLPADGESEYHLLSGGVIPGTYDIASWKWTIISKPTGSDAYITKSDKQEAEFHFTKNTKNSGSYVVRLQVCDIHNKCSNDDIRLKYIFTLVIPPIARAGRDVTETLPADGESEYHLLSGGATPGTYDIASWKWTIISKPTGSDAYITKSDKQEAEFHFTKNTKNSGSYVVRLQVCDIHNKCSNDDIRLKYIFTLVIPPIARAGRDVTETLPADGESEYHLLSGGATPGTYDIASWKWTIISKPTGSDAYITKSDKQEAEFHFTKNTKNSGSYVVRLQVCDIHNKCSNNDIRLKYTFVPMFEYVSGRIIPDKDILNNSWTISYSLKSKSWESFHSYMPNFYIHTSNTFYSWINEE